MGTAPPLAHPLPVVTAAAHWQQVDFISDIHLDADAPSTFEAWQQYLAHTAADALFILGDLFEVWVGDDTQDAFALACTQALAQASQKRAVYFVCGNRDFLIGQHWLASTGIQGLSDPSVLALGQHRMLLTHGDSLCLDDVDYLQFRQLVRAPDWQQQFLAKPLQERQSIARGLREQSEARKKTQTMYADVDDQAAVAWLKQTDCQTLIHGHTHKPATHALGEGLKRWCLSDWDAQAPSPRLEVLTWLRSQANSHSQGLSRVALS